MGYSTVLGRPAPCGGLLSGSFKGRPLGGHGTSTGAAASLSGRRRRRQVAVLPRAEQRLAKGRSFEADCVQVGSPLGSGSFGETYRGTLHTAEGEQAVVLKRVRARVDGANAMHEAEHALNVHAARTARGAVADFLGHVEVAATVGRLSTGTWLMWRYQGARSLAYYLARRDCLAALGADLGVPEAAAGPTAMVQLFEALQKLHSAGIVHRDIKPANIILDESTRRLCLIDLGAAADLRSGTNYKPTETILDPCYCPPEEYVLPTDAPHLAEKSGALAMAMSPLLWAQHRPDCFDSYSAGVVLLQLTLPFMRTTSGLRNFRGALARCNLDLEEWRIRSALPARQTVLLDADEGAGWDLACGLLRPREVLVNGGEVKFVSVGSAPRLTAAAALKHPFLCKAAAAAKQQGGASQMAGRFVSGGGSAGGSSSGEGEGSGSSGSSGGRASSSGKPSKAAAATRAAAGSSGEEGGAKGRGQGRSLVASVWGSLKSRLFDLEARVVQEATATERQTTVVQQLREEVAAGKASSEALRLEERTLGGMQETLQGSVRELGGVYASAKGFLSAMLGGGAAKEAPPEPQGPGESILEESQPGGEAQGLGAAAGRAVAGAATNAIYRSLKFTASAVTSLSEAVSSLSERAEKSAAEAAVQRQAVEGFLAALQQVQPALTSRATFEQALSALPPAALAQATALPEGRQRQVFGAYLEALRKGEQAVRQKALSGLQQLLGEAPPAEGEGYDAWAARCAADARLAAVPSDSDRLMAFEGQVDRQRAAGDALQRKQQAEAAAAERAAGRLSRAAAAEAGFRALMQEHDALIAGGSSYAQLKRSMWADPQYESVPEARRKQLFTEYSALLEEAGLLHADAAPNGAGGAPAEPATSGPQAAGEEAVTAGAAAAAGAGSAEQAQLEFLRQEQARLKEEYARMEDKLREMESRLAAGSTATAMAAAPIIERDAESVTFRFGGLPGLTSRLPGSGQAAPANPQAAASAGKVAELPNSAAASRAK